MEIIASSKYVRVSPRKLRLVADMARKLPLDQVLVALENSPKRASIPLLKVVKQAIANGTKNLDLTRQSLRLKKIEISEGPVYKRWRAVSRGRAHGIAKKTSHITVVLEGEKQGQPKATGEELAGKKEKKQKSKKEGVKDGTKS